MGRIAVFKEYPITNKSTFYNSSVKRIFFFFEDVDLIFASLVLCRFEIHSRTNYLKLSNISLKISSILFSFDETIVDFYVIFSNLI